MKQFRLAIDFDGTCVMHEYPEIGGDVPYAEFWLLRFKDAGAKVFLWTMRSDGLKDGDTLSAARYWFEGRRIDLDGANHDDSQLSWTNSPKLYAHCYIDDAAAGVPLVYPKNGKRPYLDWSIVGPRVMAEIDAWNAKHNIEPHGV